MYNKEKINSMITTHGLISIGTDSYGGNITSFQYGDKHIFMPQQVIEENGKLKLRGGSHICFPNFGPPVEIGNLKLPQHGITRKSELKKLDELEEVEALYLQEKFGVLKGLHSSVMIPLIQYEQTYCPLISDKEFPFFFKLLSTIFFLPNGFLQQITISHVEEDAFLRADTPIGIGLHPYFNAGDNGLQIHFNAVKNIPSDGHVYEGVGTEYMPLRNGIHLNDGCNVISSNFNAKVTYGGLFTEAPNSKIVLWRNEENSPYLCVEPIVSHPDQFNTPEGVWLKKDVDATEGWMMIEVDETY